MQVPRASAGQRTDCWEQVSRVRGSGPMDRQGKLEEVHGVLQVPKVQVAPVEEDKEAAMSEENIAHWKPDLKTFGIKLWVDDIRKAPEGWHHAKTVTEAIRVLDTMEVAEVSLDHDISYKVSIGHGDPRPFASPETFEPVARFIARMVIENEVHTGEYPRVVRLHSANAMGRIKMMAILSPVRQFIEIIDTPSKPCNRFEEEG